MNYRQLLVMTSLLLLILGGIWMFKPELMLQSWGVAYSAEVALIARRLAAFYLGVGAVLFLAKDLAPSPARAALTQGMAMLFAIVALMGVLEWNAGHVTHHILVAVTLELMLASAFLFISVRKPPSRV
jgi:hypothetical protein